MHVCTRFTQPWSMGQFKKKKTNLTSQNDNNQYIFKVQGSCIYKDSVIIRYQSTVVIASPPTHVILIITHTHLVHCLTEWCSIPGHHRDGGDGVGGGGVEGDGCLLYTSPSPRDATLSRMPSSA